MAKKRYKVASEAGAEWRRLEKWKQGDFSETKVGDEFQANLTAEQERALLCAGWVEANASKAEGVKK